MGALTEKAMSTLSTAQQALSDRLNNLDFFDETKVSQQEDSPWYQLGSLFYVFWMVTIATGLLLIAVYIPTTFQAYDSIILIKEDILWGIIRGSHKYGGDAMIIAATLRVYRMWWNAEYKNKGEIVFILSIVILLFSMYSGLTGYLLIWNQRGLLGDQDFCNLPNVPGYCTSLFLLVCS